MTGAAVHGAGPQHREPGTMRRPSPAGAGGMTARMLAVSWDTVRPFLHVLAAAIWVGGQLTLAAPGPGATHRFGAERCGGRPPAASTKWPGLLSPSW
jgi:hypothetical protein